MLLPISLGFRVGGFYSFSLYVWGKEHMFFLGPADPTVFPQTGFSCWYKIAGSSMQSHRHNHVDTCCMLTEPPSKASDLYYFPKPIANTENR